MEDRNERRWRGKISIEQGYKNLAERIVLSAINDLSNFGVRYSPFKATEMLNCLTAWEFFYTGEHEKYIAFIEISQEKIDKTIVEQAEEAIRKGAYIKRHELLEFKRLAKSK
jgi:hypothetical protein